MRTSNRKEQEIDKIQRERAQKSGKQVSCLREVNAQLDTVRLRRARIQPGPPIPALRQSTRLEESSP